MYGRKIGILLMGTLAVSACAGDSTAPSEIPLTMALVAGFYFGTTMEREEGGVTTNMLQKGAELTMTLTSEGSTLGRLFLPGGADDGGDLDFDLTGTWQLNGTTVTFDHEADTFLRDMSFEVAVGDKYMTGVETFGAVTLRIVLAK